MSVLFASVALALLAQDGSHGPPWANADIASSHPLHLGNGVLQVDFSPGQLDLSTDTILHHIQEAGTAILAYYGRFPVARDRMLVVPVEGKSGIFHGTTWPHHGEYQSFTRIHVGQHTTAADLAEDWMATHELVHTAFPSLDDDQHWMEEGQATYIEPVARVMTGELDAHQVWHDMVRDMPKGEPQGGDEGLNRTHTWGRTYWGGALFCLVADVEIRRETQNRKGLQDALMAVVADGGTIDHDWPLEQALAIGDKATGTHVLTKMYAEWKDKPVTVDLPKLWEQLGVRQMSSGAIEFVPDAPLAKIREGITARRNQTAVGSSSLPKRSLDGAPTTAFD
jgi:hypothetical protein